MRVMSAEDVAKWFQGFENWKPESDYVHMDEDGLFYSHPEATCIDLEYPPKLERLPFFAHCVATAGYEDQYFNGALIWFQNWGIWSLFEEGIGYRIVEQINAGAGQAKSFEVSAGHRFRADELSNAIGMLMQPMIFAWDTFYLPEWSYGGMSEFFLRISHDSVVNVITRTRAFHDKVFKQLEDLEFYPKPANEQRIKRFCHPRAATHP
jgi:hypothetical protein